jgi:hypothetical protein
MEANDRRLEHVAVERETTVEVPHPGRDRVEVNGAHLLASYQSAHGWQLAAGPGQRSRMSSELECKLRAAAASWAS